MDELSLLRPKSGLTGKARFPLRGLGWSTPYPPLVLCGWALCPGLVLLLSIPKPSFEEVPGEGVFGAKKAISGHLL